jgi:hypothetical protein
MQNINNLEILIDGWYKNAPHLPKKSQDWLATNVWWLTLIWVVLGALGVLATIILLFFASIALVGFGGFAGGVAASALTIGVIVALAFSVASIAVGAVAIVPLKSMRKTGWTFLFIAVLINAAARILQFIFDYNIFELVWNAFLVAVSLYFVFEVRRHFVMGKVEKKKIHEAKVV